ncbi:MAG TPA: NifB/NifX family molybdenum-iron cluster-binding protein [Spirochaetota bacterium]|nr:NifB/NifX family molybdenum-iron cluster-binding protein [Spirochaetota bacterium]HOM11058.1 NifB/NifX family molybdenum-iron cluster-binding protein [Spirochaetota bacterium]HPP50887.1 NifB/NifX family molybdenum-iron cluster-binding protein [Spirochaetota bacterium]HXK65381.1 NifB/NifX family molybdenum-iron cluster-binding protein [Spirochaetota bacterium]
MRIALPLTEDNNFSMHFGHCDKFVLYDIDETNKHIIKKEEIPAPPHQPGLLPRFLAEKGATCILAGGMGTRARQLFEEQNVVVITGVEGTEPDTIVNDYLQGKLKTGANMCDH